MLFVTENAGSRRNSSCKNVTGPMLLPPPRLLLPAFVRASGRALCSSSCGDEREKVLLSPGPAQLHSRMPQWSAVRWWGASSGESSFLQKMHSVNPPNRSAPASLELTWQVHFNFRWPNFLFKLFSVCLILHSGWLGTHLRAGWLLVLGSQHQFVYIKEWTFSEQYSSVYALEAAFKVA